jgi:hypothetical protein
MELASKSIMPRKQRFKPSRKPKPSPPNEDALNGRQTTSAGSRNDNVDAHPKTDDDSPIEPDLDHQSS